MSVQAHCTRVTLLYRHTVHVSQCCSGTLCTCNVPVQADGARVTCLYRTGTGTVCHVSRVRRGVFIPCPRWIVISCGYPALSSALPAQYNYSTTGAGAASPVCWTWSWPLTWDIVIGVWPPVLCSRVMGWIGFRISAVWWELRTLQYGTKLVPLYQYIFLWTHLNILTV